METTITGTEAADLLNGTGGPDYIDALGGDDTVSAGAGVDFIAGGAGADLIDGGDDADTLSGDDGDDLLNGGAGDDQLFGWTGNDTVNGGAGADHIWLDPDQGDDRVDGGEGFDVLGFNFNRGDYFITQFGDGRLELRALNPQTPELDVITNVEGFLWADLREAASAEDLVRDGPGNFAPVAADDAAAVLEDGETANLWATLLVNDADKSTVDTKAIVSVNTQGTMGTVVFDPATQQLTYKADADAFDALEPGQTATDSFTYTMVDSFGAQSTATATVTISGVANDVIDTGWIEGTPGVDTLAGTAGDDRIRGLDGADLVRAGDGDDLVLGGAGADTLYGGEGDDTLDGGAGPDLLFGGAGDDVFHFRPGEAAGDRISDFGGRGNKDDDMLVFEGYGEGAYLTRHGNEWTVHHAGGQETFWLNTPNLVEGQDYLFV